MRRGQGGLRESSAGFGSWCNSSGIAGVGPHAGAGLHYFFEAAGNVLPGEMGVDHFPGGAGDAGTDLGTGEKFEAMGGEVLRGIADTDVVRGIDGEALGADGGGDHGDLGGHSFVDLQTGAAADARGDDGDGGSPQIGANVGDCSGDLDCGGLGGGVGGLWGGCASDNGEGGCGADLADQRKDLADEIEDAIDVGEPVHGADEDEIGGWHRLTGGSACPTCEVLDVDAGGDFGDAGDVKEAAHFGGVGLGNGDDVAGGLADATLVVVHAIGLEPEIGAAQGVGGVFDAAAPDYGFDVVLEKDGMQQVGEVAGGREVIDHGAIEAFLADEIFQEGAHAGRMEAFDGNRGGRKETADQFRIKSGAGLGRNVVGEGVGLVRVLVGAGGALGLGGVNDSDVVDFMPAMQMAQHLQGADLSALGGGVHEIGVDPQGLHTDGRAAAMTPSQRSARLPVRNMS